MKYLAIALASAALTSAQTPAISIRPNPGGLAVPGAAVALPKTSVPVLGYLAGPGALEFRAILGTAKGAQLGSSIALPAGVRHVLVPPREHYVLVERASESLAVWLPAKGGDPVALPGAIAHADAAAFSARGEAVALYSKATDRLQIVNGLPAEPVVAAGSPGLGRWGDVRDFAVSDDGTVVVALLADGTALSASHAQDWQRLPVAYGTRSILFVPNSHNLIVSDLSQQTLSLVTNVEEKAQSIRVLAQGVAADRLAFTKQGEVLLAASSSQSRLWSVDLRTMTAAVSASVAMDALLPLRDGRTFLLSSSSLSLLNFPADGESAAVGFVPVTR